MNETLEGLVASEIRPLGLELFELKVGGSQGRPVLDVRVEREDGEGVTVDNCAAASRAIETRLDAEDFGGRNSDSDSRVDQLEADRSRRIARAFGGRHQRRSRQEARADGAG